MAGRIFELEGGMPNGICDLGHAAVMSTPALAAGRRSGPGRAATTNTTTTVTKPDPSKVMGGIEEGDVEGEEKRIS
jgi:hypothetical protein